MLPFASPETWFWETERMSSSVGVGSIWKGIYAGICSSRSPREGERAKVDLELASEHYRGAHLARKIQAGFKVYLAGSGSTAGSTVKEERELTAGLLSLS